jgi:hypothetical protein
VTANFESLQAICASVGPGVFFGTNTNLPVGVTIYAANGSSWVVAPAYLRTPYARGVQPATPGSSKVEEYQTYSGGGAPPPDLTFYSRSQPVLSLPSSNSQVPSTGGRP